MVEMSFTENTEAENSFHVAVCEIIDDKTFNFPSDTRDVSEHPPLREQTRL